MTFLILGSHPELSLAEICTLAPSASIAHVSREVCVLQDDPPSSLFSRLAGVSKAGRIIGECSAEDESSLTDLITAFVSQAQGSGKIQFGISVYNAGNPKYARELRGRIERIGLSVKRVLKEQGMAARLVTTKEQALSSVAVATNKLLESGGEYVLLTTTHGVQIGQTEAIQDFEAWSDRDFGRPARDAKSGMLPPKLARLMVNLSGATPETSVLLDPFCGSGTILMEAALLGFHQLIGGDISAKAVDDSKKNLDWLQKTQNVVLPPLTWITTSAQTLSTHLSKPVDAIVTETYLGPPRSGRENARQLNAVVDTVANVYKEALPVLANLTKKAGRLVIAIPAFRVGNGFVHIPLTAILAASGWQIVQPLPETLPKPLRALTPQGGLLYERSGQHVAREIFVLEKK